MAAVRKRRAGRVAEWAVVDVAAGAAAATELWRRRRELGVGLAAGVVLAAGARAIRFVDEDVIVAAGADHAVDRLGELLVIRARLVFGARLLA
jgi:hypothetical protein